MSNYNSKAKRPGGSEFEDVRMLDNYFGHHIYGVAFPDNKIFKDEECEFNHGQLLEVNNNENENV